MKPSHWREWVEMIAFLLALKVLVFLGVMLGMSMGTMRQADATDREAVRETLAAQQKWIKKADKLMFGWE